MSSSYAVQTVVRGYHVYKDIWNAATGQILPCQRERGNVHNPYAVAVVERGVTVGHVPHAISSVCSLFLGKNGTIMCEVIGSRHYLPQGGIDIPCKLIFRSEAKLIFKVQKLLQEAVDSGLLALSSTHFFYFLLAATIEQEGITFARQPSGLGRLELLGLKNFKRDILPPRGQR